MYFTETSAKSGDNIQNLFMDAAKFIYIKYRDQLHKMIEDETASQVSSNTRAIVDQQRAMAELRGKNGKPKKGLRGENLN